MLDKAIVFCELGNECLYLTKGCHFIWRVNSIHAPVHQIHHKKKS